MKIFNTFAIAVVYLFALASAEFDVQIEDHVLVLTAENFDQEIAKHGQILVEFYTPWCGHCKKLAPEYAEAAKRLSENGESTVLAKVDAALQKELGKKYGVKSFPTLFFFEKQIMEDYSGGRTTDTIISWVEKRTGPPFHSFESCEELKQASKKKKLSLIYFGELEGADFDAFKGAYENKSINIQFGFLHGHKDCAEEFNAPVPGFSLTRVFDQVPVGREAGVDSSTIVNWAKNLQLPTVFDFSEESIEPIFAQRKDAVIYFTNEKKSNAMAGFRAAAKKLQGEILFVTCGTETKIHQKLSSFLNIEESDLPTMRILSPGEAALVKYKYEGDANQMTSVEVTNFARDFLDGKLEKFLKSEDIPESQEGAVITVVGKTFNQIVKDESKDVFVEFYAPWCGHCKQLEPIWEQLASEFAGVNDLVIAKMDATANEVENFKVSGYPTIKFFSKGNKKGIDYEGERDLDDMRNFLEEKSAVVRAHNESNKEKHEDL